MSTDKITFENNEDQRNRIYYVRIDTDGRKQQQYGDKTKTERKNNADQGQEQRKSCLRLNSERKEVKRGGEIKETPKERNNSRNKRTMKLQDIIKEDEEEEKKRMKIKEGYKKENDQSKKKTKDMKKTTDNISELSSSSDEEFMVGFLSEEEVEKVMKKIDEKKQLIATLRAKPWPMHKKMSILRDSQAFINKYESTLGKRRGRKLYAFKVKMAKTWAKIQRHFNNFKAYCVPWEMKIKEIESHFGSSVASYFIFLRWTFYYNIILFILSFGLVVLPEALLGQPYGSIPRKTVPRKDQNNAMNLDVLWDVSGYIQYSVMFYGYYNDQRTIGWLKFRQPLSYFLVGVAGIAYNFIVVIQAMVKNVSEGTGKDEEHFDYSWKVFTGWEYHVGNSETADNNFAAIITHFKESFIDERALKRKVSFRVKLFIRIVSNILVIIILAGSAYLIYVVVQRSGKFLIDGMENHNWWERNEVNVVMSLLTTFVPMLFEAIALWENYHPRIYMYWHMSRVFALYAGNLYSFLIGIIEQISVTWAAEEQIKLNLTIWQENMYNKSLATNSTGFTVNPADVPRGPCWETMAGQEFIRNLLSDTVTTYVVLVFNDFLRAVAVRVFNQYWCWDLEYTFPSYNLFDLSGNLLTLIFNQGTICMGTLFAPCLPGLYVIRLYTSMYLQAWAVMSSNIPHAHISKTLRYDNFYMVVHLLVLFVSTVPTLFTLVALPPSFDCGPFSGKDRMYDVIPESLKMDLPASVGEALSYLANPGVVVPILLVLFLMVYYLYSTSRSYKQANTDLKKKLHVQREEKRMMSKLAGKTSGEYLEMDKNTTTVEQNEKQSNNDTPVAAPTRNSSMSSRGSPPPDFYRDLHSPGLRHSRRLPRTRPPTPCSHLIHRPLPRYPPY